MIGGLNNYPFEHIHTTNRKGTTMLQLKKPWDVDKRKDQNVYDVIINQKIIER